MRVFIGYCFLIFTVTYIPQCKSGNSPSSGLKSEVVEYSEDPKFKDCPNKPVLHANDPGCYISAYGPSSECTDPKYDCVMKAIGATKCGLIYRVVGETCDTCRGEYVNPKKWCHEHTAAITADSYKKYNCGKGYGESYAINAFNKCMKDHGANDDCTGDNGKYICRID
ncbi:MAG: hypothetical protein HQK54_06320 [Oligoflexales bacterium]|nr:hypothetical protein [Oligoflexales bacterium]